MNSISLFGKSMAPKELLVATQAVCWASVVEKMEDGVVVSFLVFVQKLSVATSQHNHKSVILGVFGP